MRIVTNHIPRTLVNVEDLPPAARDDFDYLRGDHRFDCRLVHYRGNWYDIGDNEGVPPFTNQWDAYRSDSFFSGLLYRVIGPDYDTVVVGTYYA